LHSSGYSVLRYDQPGHGKSSPPPDARSTTFPTLADDAICLLEYLRIEKLAAWVGVSMGGATGMYVAVARPGLVRKLIVCDCPTSYKDTAPLASRAEAAYDVGNMDEAVEKTMGRWFLAEWRGWNPEESELVRAIMKTTTVDGFRTCIHALTHESFDVSRIAPHLGRCVETASMIVGERDANLPQTMAELRDVVERGFADAGRKDAKVGFEVVPGAGHVCYIDNLSAFMKAVLGFLRS